MNGGKTRLRRIKLTVLVLVCAILTWCGIVALSIWHYGTRDHVAAADCIIVLGAAVHDANPSPVFAERIRHGIDLYAAGYARKIIFTGGTGDGQVHSESSVARSMAIQHGVPVQDILIEERSHTTRQNLTESAALMRTHECRSAIIVSDPLHMKRAMTMANDLGIQAVASPTPSTQYRSLKTGIGFLLRELYFLHHYWISGH